MPLLIRIFVNLCYKLQRALIYPAALLQKHLFTLIMLGGGLLVFMWLFGGEDEPEAPNTTYDATGKPVPGKPPRPSEIQPILIIEDGNSAFSSDLVPAMNAQELRHYSDQFYWAMNHATDGQAHQWDFFNIHGTLTPTTSFVNNLGDTCRRFEEVLKVHETQQTITGIACQQRGGGWCKLRPNSTPACGLGRKGGFSDWWFDTKRDFGDWFR